MEIIKIRNLTKQYDNINAVNNISFDVKQGSMFAFLGKNGAGKSTTINIIATLLAATSGEIIIDGHKVGEDDEEIKKLIGVVFQDSLLDNDLTVYENLLIRGSLYNLGKQATIAKIKELATVLDIEAILNQKYGQLSGGQRRIVDIAKGLINSPKILILDEPTTGLDPKIRIKVWDTLTSLREQTNLTIFLTTHYMEETKFADNVVIINQGNIIASGTPSELKQQFSKSYLKVALVDPNNTQIFDGLEYTKKVDEFVICFDNCFDGLSFLNQIRPHVLSFEIYNGDMDDVFLNVNKEVV